MVIIGVPESQPIGFIAPNALSILLLFIVQYSGSHASIAIVAGCQLPMVLFYEQQFFF